MKPELKIAVVFIVLLFFYLAGIMLPEVFWGTHFLSFLPVLTQAFFLSAVLLIGLFYDHYSGSIEKIKLSTFLKKNGIWLIAISGFFVFYSFGIYKDFYGDSLLYLDEMNNTDIYNVDLLLRNILNPSIIFRKNGERTVLSLVQLISKISGSKFEQGFKILDAISGSLFLVFWIMLVKELMKKSSLRNIAMLVGFLAPFCWIFFGHYEVYAPVFPAITAYFLMLVRLLKYKMNKYRIWLSIILIITLKLHITSVLLIPSFIFTWFVSNSGKNKTNIKWKSAFTYMILPFIVLGVIGYFYIWNDYADPRALGPDVNPNERTFLPIVKPEPPLDRYTMFHINHLTDFLNMFFLWFPAGFIIIGAAILYRKKVNWNDAILVLSGSTLLFYLMFFFATNPLLGMQMDADLFSIPGIIFLLFSIALLSQIQDKMAKHKGKLIGLALLTLPVIWVNHDKEAMSYRLETLGASSFKGYWIRSAGTIDYGIELLRNEDKSYPKRYIQRIEELKPYALQGNDVEFAHLCWRVGKYYRTEAKDYPLALQYHQLSYDYFPYYPANLIGLMESNFLLGDFAKAYEISKMLVEIKYPSEQEAFTMAIHCALEAKLYVEVLKNTYWYLKRWPDDENIQYIQNGIKYGVGMDSLTNIFNSAETEDEQF